MYIRFFAYVVYFRAPSFLWTLSYFWRATPNIYFIFDLISLAVGDSSAEIMIICRTISYILFDSL